jgi:hypothetical protein
MTMSLKQYFETASGTGVLSTADSGGKVDASVAFIMRERLTHENLRSNPFAAYLFLEGAPGHKGIRLFLKKTREDDNAELIATMTRRNLKPELDAQKGPKHLVYFIVEKVLPLIGSGPAPVAL